MRRISLHPTSFHRFLLLGLVLSLSSTVFGQGLKPPQAPPGVVRIANPLPTGLGQFYRDSTIFRSQFSQYKRQYNIDSTRKYITISEKLFNYDYLLPITVDLDYFAKEKIAADNRMQWHETILKNLTRRERAGGGGIELNIPVKIKNKTFNRIFGGDRVGLRVTGSISFELAGRAEQRSGAAVTANEARGNFTPKFKQTQQFRVEGKVGDKVSVTVDQNSEATFDFENTLKLTYTGDEDEIVQKIEAGNVNLKLPSTTYISTSANHQGLFGLKTAMRLGNLSFTGIASLERGQNERISTSGAASENTTRIKDIDYTDNQFFFVDSVYAENFENFNEEMRWVQVPGVNRITLLDVWKSAKQSDEQARDAWAVLDPQRYTIPDSFPSAQVPGKIESGKFVKLDYGKDYDYDEYRGYFRLKQRVDDADVIAVAYATEVGDTIGNIFTGDTTQTDTLIFKLVKPRSNKPAYTSTWKLTMRNVYNLGASGIPFDGFDVKVLFSVTGEDQEVEVQSGKTFNNLMGLDRLNEQGAPLPGGDRILDRNGWIFDLANGYLIFPSLTPFAPGDSTYFDRTEESNFDINRENYVKIYNIKDRTLARQRSKFDIAVTSKSVSTTYQLGFNVLEGSEIVRLNGRELVREKDYVIDYFSGELQVIAPEARRADAQIDIEYEKASLFQLDKKTLLGGRLEYEFGKNNFIGMTALYFSQSTLDQRIRVGQEPIKNLVWDVNTALNFKPNILTKVFDALPIVETSADSKLKIEAEYAQVNPDPNTFKEDGLGEKGVAYIDDFEGSKRTTSLGVQYRIWNYASIPQRFRILERDTVDYTILPTDEDLMLKMDKNRVKMNWFNPFNQVPIKEIWPNRDVNAQTGTTTNVLNMRWKNDSIPSDSAWAGIMRSTISFPDQKKTKFIEIWLKPRLEGELKNSKAQINIDIGRISEDWWVRGTNADGIKSLGNLNTEDIINNGLLDEGEDIGIHTSLPGTPGYDPGQKWAPPGDTNPAFLLINGTEGNGQQKSARYPDTEDIDADGNLNIFNDYFEYSFDLSDTTNPWIQGATQREDGTFTGWRQYRIPIRNYDRDAVVGDPDTTFQDIFFVRVWINNIPMDGQFKGLQIATIDFVGSDWEEKGVSGGLRRKGDDDFILDDSLFSVSVINDEENAVEGPNKEAYHSPPGVTGIEDRITRAVSKEQSLLLQLNRLDGDSTIAETEKRLGTKLNLVHYRTMKMFVHGDRKLPDTDSPLEFYIRFGSTEDIYYEYGERVYPHWDSRNEIVLDFDALTQTRDEEFQPDTSKQVFYRRDPKNPEKYFLVKGKPGLHNINYFVFGVRNTGGAPLEKYEVWVDELRVTDIEKETGVAMRLLTDLSIADVARVTATWEVVDDNFRLVEQQFPSKDGKDKTREKQSYTANVKLHKFLPNFLGLEIPIQGRYSKSRNIPKYFYNSDQRTHYTFDNFTDRLQALFGLRPLSEDLKETSDLSVSRSIGATIRRVKHPRDFWLFRYTINQVEIDADYSEKNSSSAITLLNETTSLSGRFRYGLNFGTNNYIRPLAFLGRSKLLAPLTSQKIYFTPSNINVNFSLTDNETNRQNRIEPEPSKSITVNTARSISVAYKLTDNININFDRNYKSDAWAKGYRARDVLEKIFSDFDFGEDLNIAQRLGVDYNPKFTSWLTPGFRWSSDFNYTLSKPNTTRDINSTQRINRQVRVDFKPATLFSKIYTPKRKAASGRTGDTSRQPARRPKPGAGGDTGDKDSDEGKSGKDGQEEGPDQEEKKPKKSPIKIPNPAIMAWRILNSLKSITLDFTSKDDYDHYNLAGLPVWQYQFGFSPDPGVDTSLAGNKQPILPGHRKTKGIGSGIKIELFKNLSSNLKYRYDEVTTQSNQRNTQSINSSYFFTGENPEENRKDWNDLIPDWTLRLSGVEKILFFNKLVQSLSLEHARTGKFTESSRIEDNEKIRENWSFSNSYQPLLGINFQTHFGVSGNVRYTSSINYTYNPSGAVTRAEQSGISFSASYSVTKGFRIPLPLLKKKTLKNEIQFSLAFDNTKNLSSAKSAGESEFVEREVNKSWKIRPSATYRFSPKVNGTAFFETGASETKRTGTYSYMEFGINMNIAIR